MIYDYKAKGSADFLAGLRDHKLYGNPEAHGRAYREGWQLSRLKSPSGEFVPARTEEDIRLEGFEHAGVNCPGPYPAEPGDRAETPAAPFDSEKPGEPKKQEIPHEKETEERKDEVRTPAHMEGAPQEAEATRTPSNGRPETDGPPNNGNQRAGETTSPNRPHYRVPLMSEIASLPWNGFEVASTFSGCGGSSLGYKLAGFHVLWANEFIPEAQKTYRANHPTTELDPRDIRTVSVEDVLLATGMRRGELDLFDGSPPCASFSTAGIREDGWGRVKKYSDTKQRTDDLFFEFVRLLDGLQPKTFVAENVAGLTVGVAKGMLGEGQLDAFTTQEETILHKLMDCGYRVAFHILNAAELGVPQSRRRVIFVGIRKDLAAALNLEPKFPRPLPYRYTIRDALAAPIPAAFDVPGVSIAKYAIGAEWLNLKSGEQSEKYFSLVRTNPDEVCPTICASHGSGSIASITHFAEPRKFSIGELRRLSGFPDDFILTGDYAQQWERLGRAVPPVMMAAIAATVRDEILIPIRDARPLPVATPAPIIPIELPAPPALAPVIALGQMELF